MKKVMEVRKKMKKVMVCLSVAAMMMFSIVGCTGSSTPTVSSVSKVSETASSTVGKSNDQINLVDITQSTANEFHVQMQAGMKAAAAAAGVNMTCLASESLEDQIQKIQDIIQTHPDAIAVDCFDATGIVSVLEEAAKAGIYVFVVDNNVTGASSGTIQAFSGTDNTTGGYDGAAWIAKTCGADAKVGVILGLPGNYASNTRCDGLEKYVKENPKMKLLGEVTANWKRDLALNAANDMIQANPTMNCIFCMNDEMALGAAQAIKASGKDVTLLGFNGVSEAIQAVYNGTMDATIVQLPELMASTFVQLAIDLVKNGTKPAESTYLVPAIVVDTQMAKGIMDGSLQPANDDEKLIFAKVKNSVKKP